MQISGLAVVAMVAIVSIVAPAVAEPATSTLHTYGTGGHQLSEPKDEYGPLSGVNETWTVVTVGNLVPLCDNYVTSHDDIGHFTFDLGDKSYADSCSNFQPGKDGIPAGANLEHGVLLYAGFGDEPGVAVLEGKMPCVVDVARPQPPPPKSTPTAHTDKTKRDKKDKKAKKDKKEKPYVGDGDTLWCCPAGTHHAAIGGDGTWLPCRAIDYDG